MRLKVFTLFGLLTAASLGHGQSAVRAGQAAGAAVDKAAGEAVDKAAGEAVDKAAGQAADKAFPIQAALVRSLKINNLHTGDVVLARVAAEWTFGGCRLPPGSTLDGRVTALNLPTQTAHQSSVALLFEAPCGEATPLALTWIALLAPDTSSLVGIHDANPVAMQAFRSSTFGEGGSAGRTGNTQADHVDMSGRQTANLPVFLGEAPDRTVPRPISVRDGQVWRIPNLSLSVASGPLESSVLSFSKHAEPVPAGAVLVLAPTRSREPLTTRVAAAAPTVTHPDRLPPPPPPPEALACAPPTCSVAPPTTNAIAYPLSPSRLISIASLGYGRLNAAELRDLTYGAALAFLGPDHLLVTFDPRALIHRSPTDRIESRPHMIRAVLVDTHTGTIERTLDWRIEDSHQYLWPLSNESVLVHAGNRLLWLGPDLVERGSLDLPGPLSFVRVSPDRTHLAIGTMHELHSSQRHAQLAEADATGPEEEVEVRVYGPDRQPIGAGLYQSSRALPPALSDRGRIVLTHAGGEFWHYREVPWPEQTAKPSPTEAPAVTQNRIVARVRSSCVPTDATLAPDLLFVVGCDPHTIDRWYRVLRPDGTLVLRGTLHSRDLPPLPIPDSSLATFCVALPVSASGYTAGSPFHAADLSFEAVRLMSAQDGKTLFTAHTQHPAPTRQPAATSADASTLALFDGDNIALYRLKP